MLKWLNKFFCDPTVRWLQWQCMSKKEKQSLLYFSMQKSSITLNMSNNNSITEQVSHLLAMHINSIHNK